MQTCDLLVKGGSVITMAGGNTDATRADVAVTGGRIVGIGLDRWHASEVIRAEHGVVIPGFVDGHRHMFSTLLRGCAANASYSDYFERIVLTYGRAYLPSDTRTAVDLATAEALDSGITTIHAWEHNLLSPAHAEAAIEAFLASGVRGRFSYGPPNNPVEIDRAALLHARDRWFSQRHEGRWFSESGLVHLGLATRAVEFGMPEVWKTEFAFGRSEGLPLTAHCSGRSIVDIHRAGFLTPHLLPIHADHADAEELELLARAGVVLCVAPVALARAGIGRSPVSEARDIGIALSLSIDSTAGSDTTDMFQVMRTTLMIERAVHESVQAFTPEDALRAATIGGAQALGLQDEVGTLEVGKRADLVVVSNHALNTTPSNVLPHLVVLSGQPRNVETVVVDGHVRKRSGHLVGVDVDELIHRSNAAVDALSTRVGARVH